MALAIYDQAGSVHVEHAPEHAESDADFAYHVATYRSFVKLSALFAAHVLLILALLAYFLA